MQSTPTLPSIALLGALLPAWMSYRSALDVLREDPDQRISEPAS